jgi:hypothetical protein
MFALLDRQQLPLDEMPSYLDRVGLYRDFNRQFFRIAPSELAALLIGELRNSGAVKCEDGWLRPA